MLDFIKSLPIKFKKLLFELSHRKILRDDFFYVVTCDSIGDIMMTLGCLHGLRSCMENGEFPPYKKIAVITNETKRELAQLYSSQYDKLVCVPSQKLSKWNNRIFLCPRYEKKFLICYPSLYIFNWTKYIKNDPNIKLLNIIRYWLFKMKPSDKIFFPDVSLFSYDKEKYPVEKGRTAVLCPFANSLKGIEIDFYEKLASELLKKGYIVYTNTSGSCNSEISGTKKIDCGFKELLAIVEDAGLAIGARSGILDWLSLSSAKIVALFPNDELMNFFDIKTLMNKQNLMQINLQESSAELLASKFACGFKQDL